MEAVEVRELLVLLDAAIKARESETALAGLLSEAFDAIDELATVCGLLPRPRTVSGRNPSTVLVDELGVLGRKIFPPWDRETVHGLNRWQVNGQVHPFTCGHCSAVLIATKSGWACPVNDKHGMQVWAWAMMAGGGPVGVGP